MHFKPTSVSPRSFDDMKKLAISSLVFCLVLMQPLAVFAQESTTSNTNVPAPSNDSNQQVSWPSIPGGSTDRSDSSQVQTASPATVSSLSLTDSESDYYRDRSRDVLNPSVPTNNNYTGALVYDYPIAVPPGRDKTTTPDLKLTYNNQAGEDISPYGYGWSDNIPSIERINKTGPKDLYSQNYFYSGLSGELATTSATSTYISKVENGDFLSYTFNGSKWTVVDKSGTQYTFGSSTSARLDNPSDGTQVYKWMLEEVRDTNNNYIKYQYYKNSGQIYPSSIIYSGNGTTDGIMEVDFLRESRSDIASSSQAWFPIVTNYRINEIDTKVSGSWVHKYALSYTTADNSRRSILSSITESARDESLNTLALPATTFSYATSTKTYSDNLTFGSPVNLVYINSSTGERHDNGVRVVDINGDGLLDIVQAWGGDASSSVSYINTTSGFVASSTWNLPIGIANGIYPMGVELVDINGDGLTDEVQGLNDGTTTEITYINTGSGFTASSTWAIPKTFLYRNSSGTYDEGTRLVDINGDGLTDVVQSRVDSDVASSTVYINNGHGFTLDPSWTIPLPLVDITPSGVRYDMGTKLVDINGDGLVDIVQALNASGTTTERTFINTGSGFVEDSAWVVPIPFIYQPNGTLLSYDEGVRLADINGDGLVDLVKSRIESDVATSTVYLNNGRGFTLSSGWSCPVAFVDITPDGTHYDMGAQLADINGDNVTDYIQTINDGTATTTHAYIGNSVKADSLKQLTLSKGGIKQFAYKGSGQYAGGSLSANIGLPLNLETVSSITTNDGLGTVGTTTYNYAGGSYYFRNNLDRKYAGFNTITVTDPSGNSVKTFYHQGNSTDSSTGEYSDDVYKLGKPYREEVYNSSGALIKKTINKWDESAVATSSNFVKKTQTIEMSYEGGGTHKDKASQFSYDGTNGNLTQRVDLGEVTGADAGTLTDVGTDDFTTSISYATSSTSKVTGLPYLETTTDHSSAKVKETRHYYDTLSLGSVSIGNETKTENLKSGSTYVNTQKTYNSYGLITQALDGRGKQTNYSYDANNLYISTSTNALSQSTGYQYNLAYGKVEKTTDSNGAVFQTVFDAFGRPLQINQPDTVATTTSVTKTAYTYTDSGLPKVTKATNYLDASTSVDFYSYADGFGNAIQDRTQTESSGVYVVKDYKYNPQGQLVAQSLPYFSNGTTTTAANTINNLYDFFTYDPLNRVISNKTAVGTTTYAYTPWKEVITDPMGKTKDLTNDAFGNLKQVDEHNGGSTYTTIYAYDGLNDLTKITDASGNVRNFTYDLLGRRLTAEDLHVTSDTSFGTTTYAYDDANNLTQTVDSKSQVVNYTYDDLNRVLTEDYTGQAGTEQTHVYDTCVMGIGRLCSVGSVSATTTYQYDPLGKINQETKTLNSAGYTTNTVYDRQGNVVTITNPDSSQIKYTYNNDGLVDSVARKESGDSGFTTISSFDYAPTGQVSYQSDANGIETYYTYDPNELYRLVSKTTLGPGANGGQNAMFSSMSLGAMSLASANTAQSNVLTTDKKTGISTYQTPIIIPGKRTTSSDTYLVGYTKKGDPIFSSKLYSKDVYAQDPVTHQLQPIQDVLSPVSAGWDLKTGKYEGRASQYLTSNFAEFKTPNIDLNFSVATTSAAVQGVQLPNSNEVKYANALGTGVDLDIVADNARFTKNVVINNLAALNKFLASTTYDIPFKISSATAIDLSVDSKLLSREGSITSANQAQILSGGQVVAYVWPPKAEDSSASVIPTHRQSITVTYELKSDGIYATKHVPASWLQNAVFPVTADLTMSFYTGAGDGYVGTQPYPAAWSTQHPDTTGRAVDYTSSDAAVTTGAYWSGAGYLSINRAFVPFDTSTLPSTATVTAATLKLYAVDKRDDFNDAYSYLNVFQGSQASNTSLVNADVDNCGDAITNPTKGSSDIDITGLSTGAYASFPLNSTGLGWINKTGYTKLCLREGHDTTNNAVVNNGMFWKVSGLDFSTSEAAGTSQDPELDITYTVPNVAPSAPTALLTDGSSNPANLSDLTPYFSAIYNDANTDDVATFYQVQVSASSTSWATSSLMWDSGQAAVSTTTLSGTRSQNVAYAGSSLIYNGATYYWRMRFWDSASTTGDWSTTTASFTLANPAPTTNYSECITSQNGTSTPVDIKCGSPLFSALKAANTGLGQKYEVQVATSSSFTSPVWDSGMMGKDIGDIASGARSPDIAYRGTPLTFATSTYYWRISFWNGGLQSSWSTPTTFTTVNKHVLQNLNYTYDANGNITRITNNSDTSDAHYVDYTYDDLNRLLTASSTKAATGVDYYQSFSYDPIGNITNKSDVGSYTYAQTGYANPHAVTAIASTTYSYDNNGNLASAGAIANTWDYRNELTQTASGTATTTYAYDYQGNRVKYSNGTKTTYYPNSSYSVTGATSTKQIYAGGQLIATVTGTGASSTLVYVNTDHLTGSNTISDTSGNVIENTDYYPYGQIRVDDTTTTFSETKKFTGHDYDSDTGLTYFGARYYDPRMARFQSEDAVFLAIGKDKSLNKLLKNPQALNSYAYANDNPLINIDADGNISLNFADYANSRPEFTQGQINVMGYQNLPYYYRQSGDPSGTTRINEQKFQALGSLAFNLALLVGDGGLAPEVGEAAGGTLTANKLRGAAFEQSVFNEMQQSQPTMVQQITIKTQSGVKTRLDIAGYNLDGSLCLVECKSSATAPLTKNQSVAFPEIQRNGGVVAGQGKAGFPGGMEIPPTAVRIVRPNK